MIFSHDPKPLECLLNGGDTAVEFLGDLLEESIRVSSDVRAQLFRVDFLVGTHQGLAAKMPLLLVGVPNGRW